MEERENLEYFLPFKVTLIGNISKGFHIHNLIS